MKYKKLPIPFEAWKNFKEKQRRMTETFKHTTGKIKKRPISLSSIILESSKTPLWLEDDDIKRLAKRGKNVRKL